MLFFLTPVIYSIDMIPAEWNGIPLRALLQLNPMADLVEITRDLLYELQTPRLFAVGYSLAWTVGLGLIAWLVHRRWGRDVGEAI